MCQSVTMQKKGKRTHHGHKPLSFPVLVHLCLPPALLLIVARLLPDPSKAVDTAAGDAGRTSRRLAIPMYCRSAGAPTMPVQTCPPERHCSSSPPSSSFRPRRSR